MKTCGFLTLALLATLLPVAMSLCAADASTPVDQPTPVPVPGLVGTDGGPVFRGQQQWLHVWIFGESDTTTPRILLIGDSISQGYFPVVQQALKGKYIVDTVQTSRSANDPVLGQEALLALEEHHYALIHFNNGLHGVDLTGPAYGSALRVFAKLLQDNAAGARLVFATSTPLRDIKVEGRPLAPLNEMALTRNAVAVALMQELGIPVDDLYPVLLDHPEMTSDGAHQNADGWKLLGQAVTSSILQNLGQ